MSDVNDAGSACRAIADEAKLERWALVATEVDGVDVVAENDSEWFHAASTMKAGVLYALLVSAGEGQLQLDAPLHVRNLFRSAVGGGFFRIDSSRDGDSSVHGQVGRTMPIVDLARAMITRSSNLATNLLIEIVGVTTIQKALADAGVDGLEIVRGVEDEAAFDAGINNRATARGLVHLFRLFLDSERLPQKLRDVGMEILLAQEFNQMIPAALPEEARVAHKTGEISSISHDAGIVLLPDREPYIVAVLTEGGSGASARKEAVSKMSGIVYEAVVQRHGTANR